MRRLKKRNGEAPDNQALIHWSTQEVRRIANRLAPIEPAHIIAWSRWRRAHKPRPRKAHIKRKLRL
ncbi:MAG: hypothetical protein EOR89_23430 [Mesorhizobium sp.]|nr:MAG: hypothetical protein EOR89_23430 [Mesorhizobium sp.]